MPVEVLRDLVLDLELIDLDVANEPLPEHALR